MTSRLALQSFEPVGETPEQFSLSPVELEELRLTAFEKGYAAGWDDASAAQDKEHAKFLGEIAQSLQDMAFGFQEARQHLLAAMQPLLTGMTAKVLPAIVRQTLAPIVAEQLMPLAAEQAAAPITVTANPDALPDVREAIGTIAGLPLTFLPDPLLSGGQVQLRMGEAETRIDLDGVIALIGEAVATYLNTQHEDTPHG